MNPNPFIAPVPILSTRSIHVATLRLDEIHPIISGNKWYKLHYYLQEAETANANTMASFGGPYSNHLVALAYAAHQKGIRSIGYVRSNQGEPITPSLRDAKEYGMELIFLGRNQFQQKKTALLNRKSLEEDSKNIYFIDEGGYGLAGAKGASKIISDFETTNEGNPSITKNSLDNYDYIICAVGTGTMMAGIINAAKKEQQIIGIPVLKNEESIGDEIRHLLFDKKTEINLLHSFHQGGYAKTSNKQISFMNELWDTCKIPTDIVYTGKVFLAVKELLDQKFFASNSKILIVHSGGLQGNRSVEKGILHF